jgi:hypothetical protein
LNSKISSNIIILMAKIVFTKLIFKFWYFIPLSIHGLSHYCLLFLDALVELNPNKPCCILTCFKHHMPKSNTFIMHKSFKGSQSMIHHNLISVVTKLLSLLFTKVITWQIDSKLFNKFWSYKTMALQNVSCIIIAP